MFFEGWECLFGEIYISIEVCFHECLEDGGVFEFIELEVGVDACVENQTVNSIVSFDDRAD